MSPEDFLTPSDLEALRTFEDQVTDGDGYMATKGTIKRLVELGVIRRSGGTRCTMTWFGQWCTGSWEKLPLPAAPLASKES